MGISLMTALEIFTQPNDLFLQVFQPRGETKWGIIIGRGIGHNHKFLISNGLEQPPHFNDREAAVEEMMSLLAAVVEHCGKELENPESLPGQIINPDGLKKDQMEKALDAQDLEEIRKRFESSDTIDTSQDGLTRLKSVMG